jgi:hypothetical protein
VIVIENILKLPKKEKRGDVPLFSLFFNYVEKMLFDFLQWLKYNYPINNSAK